MQGKMKHAHLIYVHYARQNDYQNTGGYYECIEIYMRNISIFSNRFSAQLFYLLNNAAKKNKSPIHCGSEE